MNAKSLDVFANLQMIDIDYEEVELSFFVSKVQQKLKSNSWSVMDNKLLPTLRSRIEKRAKPIQQEI
jgi:predicted GTPase